MLSFDSCWTDRALTDTVIEWTRAQVEAARPFAESGLYVNFPGVGENTEDMVREAYGANFTRLAKIKRRYDPENLFRMNQNIRAKRETSSCAVSPADCAGALLLSQKFRCSRLGSTQAVHRRAEVRLWPLRAVASTEQ